MDPALLTEEVEAPIRLEVAVGRQSPEFEDGVGARQAPARPGQIEAIPDPVAAGALMTPLAMGDPACSACG